jgi:hypothetical protein
MAATLTSSSNSPNSEDAAVLYGETEKAEVLRQLDRLLANPHLSHSKRFPSFLRFIVQEELEGRGDQLKERTLGVEVFRRDALYDTTSDPIVRVTATEIRKRIAQYYQDSSDPSELRISLPPGSYVPRFEWPSPADLSTPTDLHHPERSSEARPRSAVEEPVLSLPKEPALPPTPAAPLRHFQPWLIAAALLLFALLAGGWSYLRPRPSALDRFWSPVLATSDPVILCFPQSQTDDLTLRDATDPLHQHTLNEQMNVIVRDDLQPLVSLAGLVDTHHRRYTLIGENTATLTDLRQGPAIFLGAFDNAWTLRLTRNLRFRFGNDPQMTHFWIEDTQSPNHTRWAVDRNLQEATENYRDYAIVARFHDPDTGHLDVVAAGIARGGTIAAGEFLTQAADMAFLSTQAPKSWDGDNMEFVLSTDIIDGRSSPPRVVATYFW